MSTNISPPAHPPAAPLPPPLPPPLPGGEALAGRWTRLHPLSPLPRIGPAVAVVVAGLVSALGSHGAAGGQPGDRGALLGTPLVTELVVGTMALLTVMAGVVFWAVTRWRVVGDELQIDTGLVVRQSLRFPLRRVQAVDIVAPLVARMLGLAEVRVISAGAGRRQHGRLAYLRNAEAAAVRAQLLALAHGLAPETPEPPALPLFRVDNGRLLAASLLRGSVFLPLLFFAAPLALLLSDPSATPAQRAGAVAGGLVLAVFGVAADAWRFVNADFDFTIGAAPDGLRLHRGLLQKRHETVPYARVQALRLLQPLLWRPFGWARIELDVARQPGPRRQAETREVSRLLAPVSTLAEARWLVSQVMPGAPTTLGSPHAPPRRALLRSPLSYRFLRAWSDIHFVVTQTGRVRPALVVIPLDKVQSIRWRSGPLLRAMHLADVRVDTAGHRWVGSAASRDESEAVTMVEELSGLAREARRRSATGVR